MVKIDVDFLTHPIGNSLKQIDPDGNLIEYLVKFVFFTPDVVDEQYDQAVDFTEKGKKTVKTFHKLLSPRVKQL